MSRLKKSRQPIGLSIALISALSLPTLASERAMDGQNTALTKECVQEIKAEAKWEAGQLGFNNCLIGEPTHVLAPGTIELTCGKQQLSWAYCFVKPGKCSSVIMVQRMEDVSEACPDSPAVAEFIPIAPSVPKR